MGSSGCEVAGRERRVVVLGAVWRRREKRARQNKKTCVLFKILAGSSACVVRPGTKKNVVEELIRGVLWVRVDGPSCLFVVGL